MIAEGGVGDNGGKDGTGRKVCDRKVAVKTNIFWYILHNMIRLVTLPITKVQ
jgi:hypothetical protein